MKDKFLSARFWATLFIVGTVCVGFLRDLITAEAFIPLAILVLEWYFKREDRVAK